MTEEYFDFKNINPETLTKYKNDIIETISLTLDTVTNVNGNRNFANTLQPIINAETMIQAKDKCFSYVKNFYPDKEIRDIAKILFKDTKNFHIDCSFRKDVYQAFCQYYQETYPNEKASLTNEEQRFVEDKMHEFRRIGLHLPDDDLEDLKKMRKELADIANKYSSNINEENITFEFSREELDGVPEYWFTPEKLLENGKYCVTLKYPDYFPIMKYAKMDSVRQQMYTSFNNRCAKENIPLLARAVKLRYFIGKKLGYDIYGDYVTEERIIKNATNALNFENKLNDHITKSYQKYLANLLEFSKQYQENPLNKEKMDLWDYPYYNRVYKEHACDFNNEVLRQYFPLVTVKKGLMDIYQKLLGLKFELIPTDNKWHEEVDLYSVSDAITNELMGYFYLDLHPRDGKYDHAAVFNFISGCDLSKITGETKRLPGIVAMACNFPKDGCISFNEVETFFHEFGHIMHQLCSKPQLCYYDGFGVEKDFVEAPSQFLEFFCYQRETLDLMCSHEETREKIPQEYIEKLDKCKKFSAAYDKKWQLSYGIFDLTLHTMKFDSLDDDLDIQNIWINTMDRVLGFTGNNYFPASFRHLFGYEAGFYGYLLTETYAANMFYKKFNKDNILDPVAGMEYRKKILEAGSTKDGIDLLKDFLGEDPDEKYFLMANGFLGD